MPLSPSAWPDSSRFLSPLPTHTQQGCALMTTALPEDPECPLQTQAGIWRLLPPPSAAAQGSQGLLAVCLEAQVAA